MTGCHHKLSLAGENLWVFPSHLLKYHRQHHYFVCHPEIWGTGFLSGHHTQIISNSSVEELCCISLLYFHTHSIQCAFSFHTLQALLSCCMWSSIQYIVSYNQAISITTNDAGKSCVWFWNLQVIGENLYKEFYQPHIKTSHYGSYGNTATTSVQYHNLETEILILGYVP